MDWAALHTGLPVLIQALFGSSVVATQWGDQPKAMIVGVVAELDLLNPASLGVDDRVIADIEDEGEPLVQETVTGAREMTVQVTVTSQDQRLAYAARVALERLRTRLRFSSSIASLMQLGLALVSIGPVIEFDPVENGRVISKSALEIRVAYIHSETDTAAPFIETARISTDVLRDAAGDPLPDVAQFDVTGPE